MTIFYLQWNRNSGKIQLNVVFMFLGAWKLGKLPPKEVIQCHCRPAWSDEIPDEVTYSEGLCYFSCLLCDPHPICASSTARNLKREQSWKGCDSQKHWRCSDTLVIFPALRADQSWHHCLGLTLLAPQAVFHSHGPHLSSGAFLHKAHHSEWYGPHLPLEALLHSLPSLPVPPC